MMAVLSNNFGGERIVYRISVWQQLLGRPRMRWEDNIQLCCRKTVYKGMKLKVVQVTVSLFHWL
jgi:hypothetical protein